MQISFEKTHFAQLPTEQIEMGHFECTARIHFTEIKSEFLYVIQDGGENLISHKIHIRMHDFNINARLNHNNANLTFS